MRQSFGQHVYVSALCVVFVIGVIQQARADEPAAKGAAASVLALTSQEPELPGKTPRERTAAAQKFGGKLLVRELLRQAVLISARDQLGLATRDMTLREGISGTGAKIVEAQTTEAIGQSTRLVLSTGPANQKKTIFDKEIPLASATDAPLDYVVLATAAEAWSRAELVEALKQAGLDGRGNPQSPDANPSAGTYERISQMNIFSQFAALRELHELQHAQGESAETLGALVRAYANLGQLTSFHWNASHKVYKARSLLYAQRLMLADKQSARAFEHRAYALALAGLHAAALDDLKTMNEKRQVEKAAAPPATWAPLIEAFCRYDLKRLSELKPDEDQQELHAVLTYLAVENCGCETFLLKHGADALEIVPECYRLSASMSRFVGVSNLHRATVLGPMVLQNTLAIRLKDMPQLPAAVSEEIAAQDAQPVDEEADGAWATGNQRQAIIKSLVTAGAPAKDRQEPSWEVVGRMLEDVNFSQVYGRLEFFTTGLGWGRDLDAEPKELALEAVGAHPYQPAIKAATMVAYFHAKELPGIAAELTIVDADLAMAPLANHMNYLAVTQPFAKKLWQDIARHADDLAQETELVGAQLKDAKAGRRLAKISPRSPQAVALWINYDLPDATPRLAEWAKEYSDHPGVLRAVANGCWANKDFAAATSAMEGYLKISPDQAGFTRLAEMYSEQKQTDKWYQTLEASLDHEDYAAAHANARVKLARYHLRRKELEKAMAYGDAVSKTDTDVALLCAADCHEALKHWPEAEALIRDVARRYPAHPLDWYLWCLRTGQGDVDAAKEWAERAAKHKASTKFGHELEMAAMYYLIAGDKETARATYQKSLNTGASPYAALQLTLLGDAKGDKLQRDAPVLKMAAAELVLAKAPPRIRVQLDLLKWLANTYKQPEDAEPDLAAVDKLLKMGVPSDQAMNACFIGRYFLQHNKLELARKYLQQSVDLAGDDRSWYLSHAALLLKELPAEKAPAKK